MATTIPISFCTDFKEKVYTVRLPWGMPPTIGGLFDVTAQINMLLAALSPFLNIVACLFKLVAFVKAVPNVPQMAAALAEFAECAGVTIPSYALVLPTAIIQMLQFIFDMLVLLLGILDYLLALNALINQGDANVTAWLNLGDPLSVERALCAKKKQDAMKAELNARISGVQGLVTLLNVILVICGQSPISVSSYTPAALTDIQAALQLTVDILASIPGVPPSS